MNLGSRVRVLPSHDKLRESYPFLPALTGREGLVVCVEPDLDEPIYIVQFDPPFQTGIIPEGEHAYGYQPVEYREETDYWFLEREIEEIERQ